MTAVKIGDFARRATVSIKTLRFYDRVGVFRPAYVDVRTGYRYYEISQLVLLRELRSLRTLGCSVADLREWVQLPLGSTERLILLRSLRGRLQSQLAQDRHRLRWVDRWIRSAASAREPSRLGVPTVRTILSIPALTIRERVRAETPAIYRMFEHAERSAARHGARAPKRPFLLLHDGGYHVRNADVEVCIPVHEESLAAVEGRMVEGARSAACLMFGGSYEGAPAAHATLERWMQANGVQVSGPLRESYRRFGADQRGYQLPRRFIARSSSEYRTELQVPILRSPAIRGA